MSTKNSARRLVDRLVGDPKHGELEAFFSTTFDLDPGFVERDFLPSLLGLPAIDDLSSRGRAQLELALARLSAACVVMEGRRYQGRPRSLRLHMQPARGPGAGVLHAKVTLAVHAQAVRLFVGSANLTTSGYRVNREVVVPILATEKRADESKLLLGALRPMRTMLAAWWNPDAERTVALAESRLKSWAKGGDTDDAAFLWSDGETPLWRQFTERWPKKERVREIQIVSPFWSEAEDGGALPRLLNALRERGADVSGATVTLVCAAAQDPQGRWIPALPASYSHYDFRKLGVKVQAVFARPWVDREDGGGDDVRVPRGLHAKALVVTGESTRLGYAGSANFSLPGWGFAPGAAANVEAGVVMRTGARAEALRALIPPVEGTPIELTGDGRLKEAPGLIDEDDDALDWPAFITRAELRPEDRGARYDLVISFDPRLAPAQWSVAAETATEPFAKVSPETASPWVIPLDDALTRSLLTTQSVEIRWGNPPRAGAYPLNVPVELREHLPLGDPNRRPTEADLLAYYLGQITLEDVHAGPGRDGEEGSSEAGVYERTVSTDEILSYQVRDFVEALPGIRAELARAAVSEPAIRLAVVGAVSPVALVREIERAVARGRTATAAGFQLVELLSCLVDTRSVEVPEGLEKPWRDAIDEATTEVAAALRRVCAAAPEAAGAGTVFDQYCAAVLPKVLRQEVRP